MKSHRDSDSVEEVLTKAAASNSSSQMSGGMRRRERSTFGQLLASAQQIWHWLWRGWKDAFGKLGVQHGGQPLFKLLLRGQAHTVAEIGTVPRPARKVYAQNIASCYDDPTVEATL